MSSSQRCFLTGATGFIGSHLTRSLLNHGHRVVALIRPGANTKRIADCLHRLDIVEGRIEEPASILAKINGPVDATFHLAWQGVTAEFRNDFGQVTGNVTSSLGLWRIMQETGCKTWISVGSQAEYGLHSGVIDETMKPNPVTAYGSSKLALSLLTEHLCAMAGMRFAWLRLFSTYGPADDPHHMVSSLVKALLHGENFPLTACEQIWDFLYIEDVIEALVLALENDAVHGIYNLASGSPICLRNFVEIIRDTINPNLSLSIGQLEYRPDQVMHLEGNSSKLQAASGWTPHVKIREGIERTVAWHRKESV